MIRYTLSQKNVWPTLIGLCLIAVAILASWLVIQNLPAINPPANISLPVEAPNFLAAQPADRKFFDAGYMDLLMGEGRGKAWANVHPADRKFYTNEYTTGSGEANAVNPLANVDPADRKFFTNGYAAGGTSGGADPLANMDPADRKFFTNGYAAVGPSGKAGPLANVDPADRKFFNGGYADANGVAKLSAGVDPANRNSSSGN